MSKPRLPGGKRMKGSLWMIIVTAVFFAIGLTLTLIAYHDTVVTWMATTGIAFMVVAAIPAGMYAYHLINKKIES